MKNKNYRYIGILLIALGFTGYFARYCSEQSHSHKGIVDQKLADTIVSPQTWTYDDLRLPGYTGHVVQIAVIGEDGGLLRDTSITVAREGASFGHWIDSVRMSPRGKDSVIMPLYKEAERPKDTICLWLVADVEYHWNCTEKNGNVNMVKHSGFFRSPKVVEGQLEYFVALKANGIISEKSESIDFSMPDRLAGQDRIEACYLLDGKMTVVKLKDGQKNVAMKVPALGGELMVGGTNRSMALVHIQKVERKNLGNLTFRKVHEVRQYRVKVKPEESATILDFLENEEDRLSVGWVRINSKATEEVVNLIPGTYWVRRFITGPNRDHNAAPFTRLEVSDNEVSIDLTK